MARFDRILGNGFLALGLLVALGLSACAPVARLSVLRPAAFNARQHGETISVGPFVGEYTAAASTAEDVRQRILHAEGAPLTLVASGGALVVTGTVMEHHYSEHMQREPFTTEREETRRGQTKVIRERHIRRTRHGRAHVSVAFTVTDARTGQTLLTEVLQDSRDASRTATDRTPGAIDGFAMLATIRGDLTRNFARLILPWREEVLVRFGRCGDAQNQCETGVEYVRAGQFPEAIAQFQAAIARLEGAGTPDADDLAEAYWNLGLALEYSGNLAGAQQSILRAAELDPGNRAFAPELANVRRMAEEAQRLAAQGVTTS